eukprot:TRINITY_DN49004_c0_g1_i1.p1 TRINITY_DN49004_c0_g1~~TRINITY_DN49004_c0_g1_i1.p1  ORF type:complete len:483 (+),score=67.88 TRINITY_DN49004_c0_g1_i1:53-1501(+)
MAGLQGGGVTSARMAANLRDLASRYRGFLFDFDGLCGAGSTAGLNLQVPRAMSLRCVKELISREKRVAVVQGTSSRASTLAAMARKGGIPAEVAAWTSGEFVYRTLAGRLTRASPEASDGSPTEWHPANLGFPPAEHTGKLRVFEVSSIAKPRRWADLVARGEPPLAGLEKGGFVKRVSEIEDADVVYWDAQQGDDLGAFYEAMIELCVDMNVPMLHASRSCRAAHAVLGATARDSAENAAYRIERLGGRTFAAGKLDGCAHELGWATDTIPSEALVVTPDLGDVVEAANHGADALLLLGSLAESQLAAFEHARVQESLAKRKHMSVSERMAEDSPAMLHAASNPFFSVFKLPALLAEATRKNAEHRSRQRQAANAPSVDSAAPATSRQVQEAANFDSLEALQRWCSAMSVPMPIVHVGQLRWDERDEVPADSPKPVGNPLAHAAMRRAVTKGGQTDHARSAPARSTDTESLDALMKQMQDK